MNSTSRHPRAGSALVIETHELSRRAGTMKQIHRTAPAPAGIGVEMIRVPEGSDITIDASLESVVEGIWVSGKAEATLTGECARCLTPLEEFDSFDFSDLFFYPGRDAEDDAPRVIDEMIDLEPVIRDAVVLELPFTPLCKDDCAGLCIECGVNLNENPDHNHDEPIDPRWGKLLNVQADEA